MNISPGILEIAVVLLGVALLLLDLWTPASHKRLLGYLAAAGLCSIFVGSFMISVPETPQPAFGGMFIHDHLALFFKQLVLLAAIAVLLISVEFAPRITSGIAEFYTLTVFALSGMMFAASANNFVMVFVSLELVTITFYILTSFLRNRMQSLEAGTKYLILGALSSAFLVYGIALVYGVSGSMAFSEIAASSETTQGSLVFKLGILFILAGLGFKVAAFPYQIWVPDVYQGAPTPTTAFLAIGSKATGFVLIMRVLFSAVPELAHHWEKLFIGIAAATILYGNLCALSQRNLKRLLGYSSIANAGYLLLGIAALSPSGSTAILFYLGAYLFAVITAFTVIMLVSQQIGTEDISSLAGLNERSPLLAAAMTLSMISLAGIPPLAGFFGKFLLVRAIIEQASSYSPYYLLAGVAVIGVAISIYYYFGVIRVIYWSKYPADTAPLTTSMPIRFTMIAGMVGMIYLGTMPNGIVKAAALAAGSLPH
ncbi:MAG: NADH-quinone oxidoreductase subunit N [Verrucomicrobia subdivision 3 bacterium]|nr:NADH-quinone oxidoreductase subunit N [Limisphaerales bacterium]MCS1415065.1 NADH-quinone oxidoreductase subunit N [Limisphaerales bacterium]